MAELWLLLRDGPDEVVRDYRGLSEVTIARSYESAETAFLAGRVPWSADGECLAINTSIAGALRVLRTKLTDLPGFRGKPLSSNAWFSESAYILVIPCGAPSEPAAKTVQGTTFSEDRHQTMIWFLAPFLMDTRSTPCSVCQFPATECA